MLSEKYIAGFLDADGYIGLNWRPTDRADTDPSVRRGYVTLSFSQETQQDEVLYLIQEAIGGVIRDAKGNSRYSELRLNGKAAEKVLYRIKKHLVIKRHYCEAVLSLAREAVDAKATKAYLKRQRRLLSRPLPNYPARKWMAGYLDGDGSIQARNARGAALPVLSATASDYDREGVDLLHKAFGGSIAERDGQTAGLVTWTLAMGASKAAKALGHCEPHMIVKKDQADFILGCAKMGHFRDGKRIRLALKQLKAHPHRLSEPKANVGRLLCNIRNLKTRRAAARERFEVNGGCLDCGSQEHYCGSVCRRCYDKRRNAA